MSTVDLEETRPGIALVTMNRPERLNAMNAELVSDLHDAFAAVEDDRSCRAVVLTGAGRGFCSGADLVGGGVAPGAEDLGQLGQIYAFQEHLSTLIGRMHGLRQPIVAAVGGPAVGGGLALALASDVRVAADSATFGAVFIKVGLSACDVGVSYLLPRIVGAGRAAELMLTGRTFDAAEADRIGLVHAVVADGGVVEAAVESAEAITVNTEYGVWMTKKVLWANLDAPSLAHAMEMENRTQVLGIYTGNMTEAAAAFSEGRQPEWNPL